VTENLDELVALILSTQQQWIQERRIRHERFNETFSINVFHANGNQGQSTSELNGQFVHFQLLIDCLLRMKSASKNKNEFISLCKKEYSSNKSQLKMIDDFEKNYSPDQALTWYTKDSFLYRVLNNALRVENIDLLYLFGFFIHDIHRQLQQHQYPSTITVYRGQIMSNEELKKLKNSNGQLISMNSFLSTSSNRDVALSFIAGTEASTTGLQPVLFEIDADSRIEGIRPFADISSFSKMSDEEEVLMMLGSIFRINNIYLDTQVWIIKMRLCSDNDHDVKFLFDHMKHDYNRYGKTHEGIFGIILTRMGKFDQAEKYFHRLLKELPPNDRNVNICYQNLSQIAMQKGDYDLSLMYLHRADANKTKETNSDDRSYVLGLVNSGNVYLNKGENKRALELFEKALAIHERTLNEREMATCFNGMGNVYIREKEPRKAFDCYQQALNIQQKHLPANHPDLGGAHYNIALAYRMLLQYASALEHFQLSLKIYEESLPPVHYKIAETYHGIGSIYAEQRNFQQALCYIQKAATIYRQTLPHDHPTIRVVERNIRDIHNALK
jgi:tetratricopeptide (TPR) repeat protein